MFPAPPGNARHAVQATAASQPALFQGSGASPVLLGWALAFGGSSWACANTSLSAALAGGAAYGLWAQFNAYGSSPCGGVQTLLALGSGQDYSLKVAYSSPAGDGATGDWLAAGGSEWWANGAAGAALSGAGTPPINTAWNALAAGVGPSPVPSPPAFSAVPDGGFDLNACAAAPAGGGTSYLPTNTPWTFAAGGVIVSGTSVWGGLVTPDGSGCYGYIQTTASITTTLTGLTPGQTYRLAFRLNSRPGYNPNNFAAYVDNVLVAAQTVIGVTTDTWWPSASAYYGAWGALPGTSNLWRAAGTTAVVRLAATNPIGGDTTTFVDAVSIRPEAPVPNLLRDGSFEGYLATAFATNGQYGYVRVIHPLAHAPSTFVHLLCLCSTVSVPRTVLTLPRFRPRTSPQVDPIPSTGPWTFTSPTAIVTSGSSIWSSPQALDGSALLAIRLTASASQQLVGLTVGATYVVTFSYASRYGGGGGNNLIVSVGGQTIWSAGQVNPGQWATASATWTATAATATLQFAATNPLGGDRTTFLDKVSVTVSGAPAAGTPLSGTVSIGSGPANRNFVGCVRA